MKKLINNLVKVANYLDTEAMYEESNTITEIAIKLAQSMDDIVEDDDVEDIDDEDLDIEAFFLGCVDAGVQGVLNGRDALDAPTGDAEIGHGLDDRPFEPSLELVQ